MAINKHGLKITGLKKLAGELQANLPKSGGYYSGKYFQINYNTETGEVWGDFFSSFGQNNWNVYHNKNNIFVGNVSNQLKMQEIANLIAQKVMERKAVAHWYSKNIIAGGGKND